MSVTKTNYTLDIFGSSAGSLSQYNATGPQGHVIQAAIGPDCGKWGSALKFFDLGFIPTITTLATNVNQAININETWSDQFTSQSLSVPITDTIIVSNVVFHLSAPSLVSPVQLTMDHPTSGGSPTWHFAAVPGAGGGGDSLLSFYVTATVDGNNLTSPTYWMAVDNSVASTTYNLSETPIYSGSSIQSVQYSTNNGSSWNTFTNGLSLPPSTAVMFRGTFSTGGQSLYCGINFGAQKTYGQYNGSGIIVTTPAYANNGTTCTITYYTSTHPV